MVFRHRVVHVPVMRHIQNREYFTIQMRVFFLKYRVVVDNVGDHCELLWCRSNLSSVSVMNCIGCSLSFQQVHTQAAQMFQSLSSSFHRVFTAHHALVSQTIPSHYWPHKSSFLWTEMGVWVRGQIDRQSESLSASATSNSASEVIRHAGAI